MGWSDPQPDSRFCDVGELRLHFKRQGRGPTVLLLHGSGASLHQFSSVAKRLEHAFDVVRVDLPGFGLTGPRPDGDYRAPTYAATLADMLDVLGLGPVLVVGSSLGGQIAWTLALDHPQRVRGLVLINATGYPEKSLPGGVKLARGRWTGPLLRRWMPRFAVARNLRSAVGPMSTNVDEARIDRAYELLNRPGNRAAFVDVVGTLQPDRTAELHRIAAPTLVLRSASIDGQHFVRDIPGTVERVHPHGGHLLPEEDPAWVAEAIEDFASGPDAAKGEP